MIFGKGSKRCGSCACWCGPRALVDLGRNAKADSAKKAECLSSRGPFKRRQVAASSSCNAWEVW